MKRPSHSSISCRWLFAFWGCLLVVNQLAIPSLGEDGNVTQDRDIESLRQKTVQRGIAYLKERGQAEDGGFSSFAGTGPTSLAVAAMLRCGVSPDDPTVAKGLAYLRSKTHKDGGIYGMSWFLNYETCAAIEAFTLANQDGRYDELLKNAEKFIRKNQWDEAREKEPDDLFYGGEGYGGTSRPDLSNTAYMLDAFGRNEIITPDGKAHDWRADLVTELAGRQREDGAWQNQNTRWMEGDPNLCTAFALLSLSYCEKEAN